MPTASFKWAIAVMATGAAAFMLCADTAGQAAPASPAAQTAAPTSPIVGVGNFSHIVSSLDQSVQFYRDVIGLQVTGGAPRVFSGDLAMKVGNTPGAGVGYYTAVVAHLSK